MKEKRFKRIYIEITSVCNLNCKFCPKTNRFPGFMAVENFEIILEKIKPYTDYIYLHVKGEPLLHQKLGNILDKCLESNIKVNITTNGSLLEINKEMLIDKKAVRQINISLHSIEKGIRNVIESAKYISENSNIITQFRIWNLKEGVLYSDAKEKIRAIEKVFLRKDIVKDVLKKNDVTISDKVFLSLENEFKWPDMNSEIMSKEGSCLALKQQIAILVDGTVVPCCLDNNGDINLGNIFEERFEDILNSKKVFKILKGFGENRLEEELCQRCGFRK